MVRLGCALSLSLFPSFFPFILPLSIIQVILIHYSLIYKGASYYTKEKNMGPGVSFVFRVVKFNFVLLFESYDLKYSEEA